MYDDNDNENDNKAINIFNVCLSKLPLFTAVDNWQKLQYWKSEQNILSESSDLAHQFISWYASD